MQEAPAILPIPTNTRPSLAALFLPFAHRHFMYFYFSACPRAAKDSMRLLPWTTYDASTAPNVARLSPFTTPLRCAVPSVHHLHFRHHRVSHDTTSHASRCRLFGEIYPLGKVLLSGKEKTQPRRQMNQQKNARFLLAMPKKAAFPPRNIRAPLESISLRRGS